MDRIRILFICIHNSARSQMAEAFMNRYAGDIAEAMSAGLEPGALNPDAVEVMREAGIDISRNAVKSAFDLYKQSMMFSCVIAVCDPEAAERCPLFPGVAKKLHWPFADPSTFTGTREEVLEKTRKVRDEIEAKVREFAAELRTMYPA
jgi:arsenate reductase